MNSQLKLFSIGNFDFKINHILIIGILALSFSISFLIRSLPADYGWELNEFDPFFNYRATQYIVENGISSYFSWNDDLSWYPHGRDISLTSQSMLHIITAVTYVPFGFGIELYDYTIIFPVIVGSLSAIMIFFVTREIGGTTAGLFSSLLFSISLAITVRGFVGWFKSEPLGLFLGLISVFFLLNCLNSKFGKNSIIKISLSGIFLSLSISAWGGNQFFVILVGLFFISLPFVYKEKNSILKLIPIFSISFILVTLLLERPGINFILGLGGLTIIGSTLISMITIFIQKKSIEKLKIRNSLIFLCIIILILSVSIFDNSINPFNITQHRYLNAINPLLTTTDPLTDSVSEHETLNINQSFQFHSVLMLFAGMGIWLLFKKNNLISINNHSKSLVLILVIFGAYIGSAFMRLEVFTSLSIIIISSIGITLLLKSFKNIKSPKKIIFTGSFSVFIIVILLVPLFYPATANVLYVSSGIPPTILNGGTNFKGSFNDWRETLEWINTNTDSDSVIGSWWDYGYWIQTISERKTLVDNSTLIDSKIKKIAKVFFMEPEEAWSSLISLEADYFIIFVSAEKLTNNNPEYDGIYLLGGGGDESKKVWFGKIAGVPLEEYFYPDLTSSTSKFWENTLLGKLIPFQPIGYVDNSLSYYSDEYQFGFIGLYEKQIKFPEDSDGPFRLVYSSSSFKNANEGEPVIGVLVYEINKEYVLEN